MGDFIQSYSLSPLTNGGVGAKQLNPISIFGNILHTPPELMFLEPFIRDGLKANLAFAVDWWYSRRSKQVELDSVSVEVHVAKDSWDATGLDRKELISRLYKQESKWFGQLVKLGSSVISVMAGVDTLGSEVEGFIFCTVLPDMKDQFRSWSRFNKLYELADYIDQMNVISSAMGRRLTGEADAKFGGENDDSYIVILRNNYLFDAYYHYFYRNIMAEANLRASEEMVD